MIHVVAYEIYVEAGQHIRVLLVYFVLRAVLTSLPEERLHRAIFAASNIASVVCNMHVSHQRAVKSSVWMSTVI